MGLLPQLEGIYRTDLGTESLWQQFRRTEHYRKLEDIDGILLTHAHLDHSGHISFLREDIPIYTTATTAFIAKAMQDSGKAPFDQQVCYFAARVEECLEGWRQGAYVVSSGADRQRRFFVADKLELSEEAEKFWGRATRRNSCWKILINAASICVVFRWITPFPVPVPGVFRQAPVGLFTAVTCGFMAGMANSPRQ